MTHRTLAAFALGLAACAPAAAQELAWQTEKGLSAPESAYPVPGADWIAVSNVAGDPGAKDGSGWISRVGRDGAMLEEKWVSGLNAPKGLRALGEKLYAADIDVLVEIDLKSGKVLRRVPAAGAKLLNDVAIDDAGAVYVSDTLGNRVYRLGPKGLGVFLEGGQLQGPNGLAVHGGKLYVAGWGAGTGPDWSTKGPAAVTAYDLKTKKGKALTGPLGQLDGIERAGEGWLVSDWKAKAVHRVDDSGKASQVVIGIKSPADIGWLEDESLLLVPRMQDNALSAYKLE